MLHFLNDEKGTFSHDKYFNKFKATHPKNIVEIENDLLPLSDMKIQNK